MAYTPVSREVAEGVRDAAVAVDGVAALHGGRVGEIATYLPNTRIEGLKAISRDGTAEPVLKSTSSSTSHPAARCRTWPRMSGRLFSAHPMRSSWTLSQATRSSAARPNLITRNVVLL